VAAPQVRLVGKPAQAVVLQVRLVVKRVQVVVLQVPPVARPAQVVLLQVRPVVKPAQAAPRVHLVALTAPLVALPVRPEAGRMARPGRRQIQRAVPVEQQAAGVLPAAQMEGLPQVAAPRSTHRLR
jgi:hypothetical protein